MIQCAVRIGSILLICVAATSVVAGPRGGAPFGGGVHFGGGGGAPHFSRPHFSAPPPFTPQVGPQLSARPGHLLQHVTPGRVGSAPLLGSVRQIPRPTNQAANAFALSGVHRFGSGQILRNPLFVNRPALAHTIFRGRFAQFSSRHHQHFLPIIAVGFIGPLFWPYAYDDFLNYTFYPYAYDAFWPGAYDDVYDGITGVYGAGIAPGYAGSATGPAYVGTSGRLSAMLEAVRTVRAPLAKFYALLNDEQKARFNALSSGEDQNEPGRRRSLSVLCSERVSGISSVPIRRMELTVRPDEGQRASLRALQDAIAQAGELLKTDCPTYRPITPVVRIDAMEQRLDTMLRAINIVQPALQKFYGSLTDEQKERFNRLAPVQG